MTMADDGDLFDFLFYEGAWLVTPNESIAFALYP